MIHNNIVIMNFSHVYEEEKALSERRFRWIDCTGIRGTDCYLSEQAEGKIKEAIKEESPEGIHFIDSGNYHYVSKLWTDKIHTPFSMVVFDHHTDMQQGVLIDRVSCGSWVKKVLDENPYLKKVILVGVKEELLQQVEVEYKDRIICYGEHQIKDHEVWKAFAEISLKEPVYISIDKDVLSKSETETNWDQGSLTINELETLLTYVFADKDIIGVDICGEAATNEPLVERQYKDQLNNKVNEELLAFLAKQEEEYGTDNHH